MKNVKFKRKNLSLLILIIVSMLVFICINVRGQVPAMPSSQYYEPSYQQFYSQLGVDPSVFWPGFANPETCNAERGQDFFITVPPGGCSPKVVRSDLLGDQNVPVFCKLVAVRVNPLVDVAEVKSVGFTGQYPKEVLGVSYHPSKALLKSYNPSLGSGMFTDIGYVVVLLKQQPVEKNLSNSVRFNLTANIKYDLRNVAGIGKALFYLPVLSDEEWESEFNEYSFWRGKGFIRAESIDSNRAKILIYSDKNHVVKSFDLKKGETSGIIYIPGFYCRGGLRINLVDITIPKKSALIQVDDDMLWVTEGSSFLDVCRVNRIDRMGGLGGQVIISCEGKQYSLNLLEGMKALINGNEFSVGERVGSSDDGKDVYLVYVGIGKDKKEFVVLAKNVNTNFIENNKIKDNVLSEIYRNSEKIIKSGKISEISSIIRRTLGISSDQIDNQVSVIEKGNNEFGLNFEGIVGGADLDLTLDKNNQLWVDKYFDNAKKTAEEISGYYPGEGDNNGIYGARALSELAKTAIDLKKYESAKILFEKVIKKYPETSFERDAEASINNLMNYNLEKSSAIISVKKVPHTISLKKIKEPSAKEAGIILNLDGKIIEIVVGESVRIEEGNLRVIKLINLIDENTARIEYTYVESGNTKTETKETRKGDIISVAKKNIAVSEINYERVAFIQVLPEFPDETASVNVSVNIGIEKRGIQLSDSKINEKIRGLNKTIKEYEKIISRLENWTDVQSKACFVTSTILLFKNLFQNLGGKGMARKEVMNGWNSWCEENKDKYGGDFDKCIFDNRYNIEKGVNTYSQRIQEINNGIRNAEARAQTNKASIEEEFAGNEFANFCKGASQQIKDTFNNCDPSTLKNMYKNGVITMEQMKSIMLHGSMSQQNLGQEGWVVYEKTINNILNPILEDIKDKNSRLNMEEQAKKSLGVNVEQIEFDSKTTSGLKCASPVDISKLKINNNLQKNKQYFVVQNIRDGKTYLIALEKSGKNYNLCNGPIYELSGDNLKNIESDSITFIQKNLGSNCIVAECSAEGLYNNKYLNPECRYYEREPYKGKVAIVPVDVNKGWYAATEPITYGIGKPYTEAGQVMSMWLCNVGSNGREENRGGDDKCTRIDTLTGQSLQIPYLSESESRNLIMKARQLLEQVSSQYGRKKCTISGVGDFAATIASPLSGTKCTDFMSPIDCRIMFNLCDPVICPVSRCDLGGKYPVPDVIQSGIFGSIFLCLPNFPDVVIPVCLTGIKEGLKAYISVLKSHRDCLEENLRTGKMVGICDEMYSINLCELFWRQVGPLLDIGIQRLFEAMLGQNRGGGEYATVNYAFENMRASVNYIQNSYTQNIPRLFKTKSVGEMGTEICKSFVSVNYPLLGDLADSLLKPESPVQFSAWYDVIPFSEATVPPTSQYKVYYHIYAGTDRGAYFSVYLASPPESGYYSQQLQYPVASGYIGAGQHASETKDFTAPAGYKEVCIRVNEQEKCGFGRVSSDFGLNFLNDKFLQEQATQKVTSEKECIAGTPSIYSLAQPNLQAGVEEMIQPELYNKGIIRVCSSDEPGITTEPGRWKEVGYCDQARGIKCWLDTKSVKRAVEGRGIEKATVQQINQMAQELLQERGMVEGLMTPEQTQTEILNLEKNSSDLIKTINGKNNLNDLIDEKKINEFLSKANDLQEKIIFNKDKARILYIKFTVEKAIIDKLRELIIGTSKEVSSITSSESTVSKGPESTISPSVNTEGESKEETFEIKLSEDYDPNKKIYLLVNNEKTKIYFLNNKIWRQNDALDDIKGFLKDLQVGNVDVKNQNKIVLILARKDYIEYTEQYKNFKLFDMLNDLIIQNSKISVILPKPEIKEIWASMPGFSPYIVWQGGVFINQKIIIDSKTTEFNSVNIKVVHSCNSGLNVSSIQDSVKKTLDNKLIRISPTEGDFFNLETLFSKTSGNNFFLEIGCSGEPGSNVKVPIEIK